MRWARGNQKGEAGRLLGCDPDHAWPHSGSNYLNVSAGGGTDRSTDRSAGGRRVKNGANVRRAIERLAPGRACAAQRRSPAAGALFSQRCCAANFSAARNLAASRGSSALTEGGSHVPSDNNGDGHMTILSQGQARRDAARRRSLAQSNLHASGTSASSDAQICR
jgi:hypothetical protein